MTMSAETMSISSSNEASSLPLTIVTQQRVIGTVCLP